MIDCTSRPPNQFFLNLVTSCQVFVHISRKGIQCRDHRGHSSHALHKPPSGTDRTEANQRPTEQSHNGDICIHPCLKVVLGSHLNEAMDPLCIGQCHPRVLMALGHIWCLSIHCPWSLLLHFLIKHFSIPESFILVQGFHFLPSGGHRV